jgi:hypothetical protein
MLLVALKIIRAQKFSTYVDLVISPPERDRPFLPHAESTGVHRVSKHSSLGSQRPRGKAVSEATGTALKSMLGIKEKSGIGLESRLQHTPWHAPQLIPTSRLRYHVGHFVTKVNSKYVLSDSNCF